MTNRTRVSIGVPAFNSGRFVRESLLSLLAQDHPLIEIVISDDGSSDDTAKICAEFAERDPRVTLHRMAHLGERMNFNTVLSLARGPYFMWAADHDLWDPRYVSSCVAALESDRRAVLAYAHTMLIDADGREVGVMDDDLDITQPRAIDRYRSLIWRLTACNAIYGVMRLEALLETGGYASNAAPDHLVLAEMALKGTFIQLPDIMYLRRQNRPPETVAQQRHRTAHDLEPREAETRLARPVGSYYRSLLDGHLRAVSAAAMPVPDKWRAVVTTLRCFEQRFGVQLPGERWVRLAWRLLPVQLRRRLRRPGDRRSQ